MKKVLLLSLFSLCVSFAYSQSLDIASADSLDMSDEAKMIIADTLKFNAMFDSEVDSLPHRRPYPSKFLLPLAYDGKVTPVNFTVASAEKPQSLLHNFLGGKISWLENSFTVDSLRRQAISNYCARNPMRIVYDANNMKAAPDLQPQSAKIPSKVKLGEAVPVLNKDLGFDAGVPKAKCWQIVMKSVVQFSQIYVTDNWYQGGESNLNILSIQNLSVKYYDQDNIIEFETTADLKNSFYTTNSDTVRSLRVNEDLLQINSKFGVKAISTWYYTAALQFKTQLFNNYESNSKKMTAQFLSPGEVNLSAGMDYKYENQKKTVAWSLLLAPLSYNLKFVANIDDIDETSFGITEGQHTLSQVGSSLTNKMTWKMASNISWESRLYYFTNYDKSQGEFENVFNFSVNKNLSTRFSLHWRYDDDTDDDLFQFKELLSFGLNYVW